MKNPVTVFNRVFVRAVGFALLFGSLMATPTVLAQEASFRARLSPMPTTPQTKNTITGSGEVGASLAGNTLTLSGNFAGMNSIATMAHLHLGPPAQPGPVIATLSATEATGGELSAAIELSDEQLAALRANSLYIQVHSATNPAGELRGWLFVKTIEQ